MLLRDGTFDTKSILKIFNGTGMFSRLSSLREDLDEGMFVRIQFQHNSNKSFHFRGLLTNSEFSAL